MLAKYLKIDDPMKLSLQDIQSVFDKFEKNQNHRAGRNETSGFENSENKN